jgi:hypothetical protein
VSTDGNSYLEGLWNSTACALCNAIDAYGWIIPALLLTALLLGALFLIGLLLEDCPIDPDLPGGICGVFKWAQDMGTRPIAVG